MASLACAVVLHSTTVHAQWTPLRLGTTNSIVDEFDGTLKGNHPSSHYFGLSSVQGDLIQVLAAPAGILPPQSDGTPHFANALLHQSRIGDGTSPQEENPGCFGTAVMPRPNGEQVFIRVFNAPTLEEASFYCDSQIHEVSGTSDDLFVAEVAKTDKALDTNDNDGDGLHNSWEKSYGSNPDDADSDNDGVGDGEEHLAGTDPSDSNSVFVVARLLTSTSGLTIEWDAVPGRNYVVECSTGSPLDGTAYTPVSLPFVAESDLIHFPLTNGLDSAQSSYRVRVVAP